MSAPDTTAWEKRPHTVDEQQFTPWASPGWTAWNGQSPELEVVMFVEYLVTMMQPRLVIETGVGQGFMTRAIAAVLPEGCSLISYESDDAWRAMMWSLPFWQENRFKVCLSERPSPDGADMTGADLCVFDSEFEYRFDEIERWHNVARQGAVALIHDTADRDETIHKSVRELVTNLGMTGTFLHNPRGCFLAVQPAKET